MDEFLSIFREHEEELEVACPEFAVRVQELMQADIVASNRVGSRYSKQFSEDISMRCGRVAEDAKKSAAGAGSSSAGGGGEPNKTSKKRQRTTGLSDPELSLEERVKLQLQEKMAEDREMSQLVATMEEKILDMGVEEPGNSHVEEAKFVEMCDECGIRHIQIERECHFCGDVHEGCCDM